MTSDGTSFKKKYLAYSKTNHAHQTTIRIKTIFKNFNNAIYILHLAHLTPEVLEKYKSIRKDLGLQGSTINRELITLKVSVKRASTWGYNISDLNSVTLIPITKKRPIFFTKDEIQSILKAAKPVLKTAVLLGFYAGLRRDEILHLEWSNVDLEQRRLNITPKADWHPKDKEPREIPLHPDLEKHLKKEIGTTRIIGWNFTKTAFSQAFTRLLQAANLKHGSLHTLRHSFASHLAMNGIDLHRIRELMGHSSINTTQIYAHLSPSRLNEAITKLPSI